MNILVLQNKMKEMLSTVNCRLCLCKFYYGSTEEFCFDLIFAGIGYCALEMDTFIIINLKTQGVLAYVIMKDQIRRNTHGYK